VGTLYCAGLHGPNAAEHGSRHHGDRQQSDWLRRKTRNGVVDSRQVDRKLVIPVEVEDWRIGRTVRCMVIVYRVSVDKRLGSTLYSCEVEVLLGQEWSARHRENQSH
jgi:hypothetical protein